MADVTKLVNDGESGQKYRIKLHDNGDGTYSEAVAATGATPAGEAHIGSVAGESEVVSVTPTVTATAYEAKDAVGTAQALVNAVRTSGGKSVLQSIFIIDRANQKAPLNILIFDSNPSDAGTTITDEGEPTLAAADISKAIRCVSITAADYVTVDHAGTDVALADITAISKMVKAASGTTLYALPVVATGGAPTYTANCLTFRYGFLYAS